MDKNSFCSLIKLVKKMNSDAKTVRNAMRTDGPNLVDDYLDNIVKILSASFGKELYADIQEITYGWLFGTKGDPIFICGSQKLCPKNEKELYDDILLYTSGMIRRVEFEDLF